MNIDGMIIFFLIFVIVFFSICLGYLQISRFMLSRARKLHQEVEPLLQVQTQILQEISKVDEEQFSKLSPLEQNQYLRRAQAFLYLADIITNMQSKEEKWIKRGEFFIDNCPANPILYWWSTTFGGPEL